MTAPLIVHAEGRKASWFELFFDLVFVTAVAGLATRFARAFRRAGLPRFCLPSWFCGWLWLGHTFLSSGLTATGRTSGR